MLRFFITFIMFATSVKAYSFRHTDVNRSNEGYYYVMVGLILPLTNKTDNVSLLGADVNPDTQLGQIMTKDNIPFANTNTVQTFPARKIGAMAAIGYKSPYIFRTDFKIDFLNFGRIYTIPGYYFGGDDLKVNFLVRQLGFIGSIYLDLDNPTFITPYIGVGAGGTTTQATFSVKLDNNNIQEPGTSILSNLNFVYELKAGMKFGPKNAFLDVEAFIRRTPKYELESKGVMIKAGFRI